MSPRLRPQSGQSTLELIIFMSMTAILGAAGISSYSVYNQLQIALQAGIDLRTIEQAQKIAVINGLSNPTLLTGYGTANWPITVASLEQANAVSPNLMILQKNWAVDTTTIPPTLAVDSSASAAGNMFAGTVKNPNINQSGDGMFDVGNDSYYSLNAITH